MIYLSENISSLTPVKQVTPAENLPGNTETPISFVLFGPIAREIEIKNQAKPRIIQITSFRCRR